MAAATQGHMPQALKHMSLIHWVACSHVSCYTSCMCCAGQEDEHRERGGPELGQGGRVVRRRLLSTWVRGRRGGTVVPTCRLQAGCKLGLNCNN